MTLSVLVIYSLSLTSPAVAEVGSIVSGFDTATHFVLSASYAHHVSAEERSDVFSKGLPRKISRLIRGRTTFAWPWNADAIDALQGSVAILPSPQQLTTYTPALDDLDANYLSSKHRPIYGLLNVNVIDGRLPLQTAGKTFRAIMSCYTPLFISDGILLVKSNVHRACDHQSEGASHSSTAALNTTWIAIPPHGKSSVYLAAQIRPTLRGRLKGLIVHESVVYIEMQLRGGQLIFDRLIPATLVDGVLASAVINSVHGLRSLWRGAGAKNDQVVRVRITAADSSDWVQSVRYRLFEVAPGEKMGSGR